jgi:DtxR family Mn-dependent transcriptional regulator
MAEHGAHSHTPQEYHPPVEEYLETMLALAEEGVPVIQARIAERLGRSAPSVSEMLDRLIEDGYVTRDRRRLSLTDSGRALAEKVVRKHRLAERLLVDVIGLEWHKVHREAGRWEHVISDDVEARLVELLGDPATCPHGNPIPGSHSPSPSVPTRPLTEAGEGERVRLLRISEEVELNLGSLTLLDRGGFIPGAVAEVGRRDPDGTMELTVEGGTGAIRVSRDLSDRLFVAAL